MQVVPGQVVSKRPDLYGRKCGRAKTRFRDVSSFMTVNCFSLAQQDQEKVFSLSFYGFGDVHWNR